MIFKTLVFFIFRQQTDNNSARFFEPIIAKIFQNIPKKETFPYIEKLKTRFLGDSLFINLDIYNN
jgi:hypothetical protein